MFAQRFLHSRPEHTRPGARVKGLAARTQPAVELARVEEAAAVAEAAVEDIELQATQDALALAFAESAVRAQIEVRQQAYMRIVVDNEVEFDGRVAPGAGYAFSGEESVEILTHFESDYGAAPQVKMKEGQIVTVIDPAFSGNEWIGFRGRIIDNPTLQICRTQLDIEIEGDWEKLLHDMKGFHWLVVYGDYLSEIEYALKKMGINWRNLSKSH